MFLTEEEARGHTCHKTLGATVIAGEANYYPTTCCASECMAWRWGTKPNPDYNQNRVQMFPSPWPPSPADQAYIRDETRGYCGLAGAVLP